MPIVALVLAQVLAPGVGAQGLASEALSSDAPVTIRSTGYQYGFPDDDDPGKLVWVFLDGVEVEQGSRRMLGETLVLVLRRDEPGSGEDEAGSGARPATGEPLEVGPDGTSSIADERIVEFFLDGNVTLEEGDERLVGAASLHVDNTSGRLSVVDGTWHLGAGDEPFQVRFEVMRELGAGVRELEGLVYTTCEYAHEHWSLSTPWARLVDTPDGRVLHTGGNTAELGRVPVTWFPGIHLNIDRERPPIRSVGFGTNSRFGTQVQTVWGAPADEFLSGVAGLFGAEDPVEGEWEVELHDYTSRGIWIQPKLSWSGKSTRGRVLGSFIEDDNKRDANGTVITDSSRGRFDVEYRAELDENRTLDVEISHESDSGFLREYYENETRTDKPQETYVNYRDVEDNRALSVLGKWRLNDWHNGPETSPSVTHRIVGQPVDLGPLGTAHLEHTAFVDNVRGAEPGYHERAGSRGDLVMDWDVGDGDRLQLSGGWDLVTFGDTAEGGGDVRRAVTGGASWIQTWSGVAEASSDLWNIDGVRHVVEPRIGYGTVGAVNVLPDELIPIDEVETLEPHAAWLVGFRHRIQTRRGDGVATLFDLDVRMPVYPNENRDNVDPGELQDYQDAVDAGLAAERPEGETLGPVRWQLLWTPGADIWGLRQAQVRWRADADTHGGGMRRSFASYANSWSPSGRFALSHTRVANVTRAMAVGLSWELTPKWTVAWLRRDDLTREQTVYEAVVFRQRAHRWLVDIELSQRRGVQDSTTDIDTESQVILRARPSAFHDPDETLLDDLGRIR